MTKSFILASLEESNAILRNAFDSFFFSCKKLNIPLYVLSGGLKIMIDAIFNSITNIYDYNNFHILSNNIFFGADGRACDSDMSINGFSK